MRHSSSHNKLRAMYNTMRVSFNPSPSAAGVILHVATRPPECGLNQGVGADRRPMQEQTLCFDLGLGL